jgi:ketosteroid isomerase-like protein
MSQENVEIVRRGFDAWEAGDLPALIALLDDDMVTRRHPPAPPGTWHGPEGAIEAAADWVEMFDQFTMKAEDYIDGGEHVVVRVAQEGRGTDSGVPVTATFWFVYGVRNGKLVTLDMHASRQEALEAAGLSE